MKIELDGRYIFFIVNIGLKPFTCKHYKFINVHLSVIYAKSFGKPWLIPTHQHIAIIGVLWSWLKLRFSLNTCMINYVNTANCGLLNCYIYLVNRSFLPKLTIWTDVRLWSSCFYLAYTVQWLCVIRMIKTLS